MPDSPFERFQQYKARRVSPSQGMGVETQSPSSEGKTTGLGAVAGGITGAVVGSRLNPLATEALSAGGAGVGDLLETGLLQALDPEREVSVGGALKSAGQEMALSLVGGGVVRGGAKAVDVTKQFAANRLARATTRTLTPEAEVAIGVLKQKSREAGIPELTLAEMSENSWLDFIDNIAKNSIMGSDLYRKLIVKRQDVTRDIASDLLGTFGKISEKDPASVGKMFEAVFFKNKELKDYPAKLLRNSVEDNVARLGLRTSASSISLHAKEILKKVKSTGGIGAKRQGKQLFSGIAEATRRDIEDIFSSTANLSPNMPVADLIRLRSEALDYQRGISINKKLKKAPIANNLRESIGLMNDAIEEGLKQQGSDPSLLAAWHRQNKMFRNSNTQFLDDLGSDLIKQAADNPAGFVKAVFAAKSDNGFRLVKKAKDILKPENIRDMSSLPKNADMNTILQTIEGNTFKEMSSRPWSKIQAAVTHELLDRAYDPASRLYSGQKLLEAIHTVGQGTLSEALGPQVAKEITDLGTTLHLLQTKNPVAIGGMTTQFVQAGAVLSLFRKVTGEAVAVILGPNELAKVMTRKGGSKLLEEGIRLERSNPRATALVGRILAMAGGKAVEGSAALPPPSRPPIKENQAAMMNPLMASLMGPAMTQ